MDRRTFVSGLAALAGGALAGCTGAEEVPATAPPPPEEVRAATPTERPEPDGDGRPGDVTTNAPVDNPEGANSIVLVSQDVFADDDGGLVVTVGVRNDGLTQATALVSVTVQTDSGEFDLERFVDLQPSEDTRVRFTPDAARDAFDGMSLQIRSETPETPLPTETQTPTPSPTPSLTGTPTDTATETATDTATDGE